VVRVLVGFYKMASRNLTDEFAALRSQHLSSRGASEPRSTSRGSSGGRALLDSNSNPIQEVVKVAFSFLFFSFFVVKDNKEKKEACVHVCWFSCVTICLMVHMYV
jgi:hypothetical protein